MNEHTTKLQDLFFFLARKPKMEKSIEANQLSFLDDEFVLRDLVNSQGGKHPLIGEHISEDVLLNLFFSSSSSSQPSKFGSCRTPETLSASGRRQLQNEPAFKNMYLVRSYDVRT